MGTEEKLMLRDIIDINDGLSIVDDDSVIPFEVSYKLGLQGNYCKPFIDSWKKEVQKLNTKYNQEREELLKGYKEDKDIPIDTINELTKKGNKLTEDQEALKDLIHDIKIIEFKKENFKAEEDTKRVITVPKGNGARDVETLTIKKGQSLVPIKFFKLCAKLIKD